MGAPADAIREFLKALTNLSISAQPRYVKDDVAELRRAFPDDADFAQALRAVTARLADLAGSASELDHDLAGWWRIKFRSGLAEGTDLRIVFRSRGDGFELRAFGHRYFPESVYRRAVERK